MNRSSVHSISCDVIDRRSSGIGKGSYSCSCRGARRHIGRNRSTISNIIGGGGIDTRRSLKRRSEVRTAIIIIVVGSSIGSDHSRLDDRW